MNGRLLAPGVVIAGIEACWLYALLDLLRAKTGTVFPETGILCFYPLSYAYHAWIPWPRRRWFLRELIGWLLWTAILISWASFVQAGAGSIESIPGTMAPTASPSGLLTAALSGALWFMGHRLGNRRPGFPLCLGEFQFGITMLMIIYFLDAQLHISLTSLFPVTVAFFVFGLTGLLLTRAGEGNHASQEHRRGWRYFLLAGGLLLILAIAFWIFSVVKVGLLTWILATLSDIGLFVARMIARFFAFIAGLFPDPELSPVEIREPRAIRPRDPPLSAPPLPIPDILMWVGRIILFMGWLCLVLLALWMISADILNWLRKRMGFSEGAQEEGLRGAFGEDLRRLLRAIREIVLGWIERVRLRRDRTPLDPGIAGVRQAYRRLLAWAAAGGCVRKRSQTPDEHLAMLKEWLPEAGGEFAFITGQYVKARYGRGPVGEEILGELAFCIRRVRKLRRRTQMRMPFHKARRALFPASR